MGPFKMLGNLFNSMSKGLDSMDKAMDEAKREQEVEHKTNEYQRMLKLHKAAVEFNNAVNGDDFKATITKASENMKTVDDAFKDFMAK